MPALREAIRRADPDLSVDVIGTGRAVLTGRFELLRSAGIGTLYLGAFTLLLSMVGLFGVQSHAVSHARARLACACRSAPAHGRLR